MDYALACFEDHRQLVRTSEDTSLIISSLLGLLDLSRRRFSDPCTTKHHLSKVSEILAITMEKVALHNSTNTVNFDVVLPFLSGGSKYVE